MTNDAIRAVVITGKYAVQTSPREKRNNDGIGKLFKSECIRLKALVALVVDGGCKAAGILPCAHPGHTVHQ